jgi:hypothetical protein
MAIPSGKLKGVTESIVAKLKEKGISNTDQL